MRCPGSSRNLHAPWSLAERSLSSRKKRVTLRRSGKQLTRVVRFHQQLSTGKAKKCQVQALTSAGIRERRRHCVSVPLLHTAFQNSEPHLLQNVTIDWSAKWISFVEVDQ